MPKILLQSLKNKARICLLAISIASAEIDKHLCTDDYDKANKLLELIEWEIDHARDTFAKIQDTRDQGD